MPTYDDPFLDHYSNLDEDEYKMTTLATKEFFHSPYSFNSYLLTCFLKKHFDEKQSILNHVQKSVWVQKDNFYATIEMLVSKFGFVYTPANEAVAFLLETDSKQCLVMLNRCKPNEFDNVAIYSNTKEFADEVFAEIEQFDAQIQKLSFTWLVNAKGDSVDIVEEWEERVDSVLYPFVTDFDTYAERFNESKSNILILIGPPGTGKTTFIKHLLSTMEKKAYITYDEQVLSSDSSFADFIANGEAGSFIVEDADLFLRSRADGNGMVSRFLNIGDGLIKLKNKKLIFSTNLASTSDMDPALVRPGRCFDILHFRSLTPSEAQAVAISRGIELKANQESYTLAEVFNSPVAQPKTTKFGFF